MPRVRTKFAKMPSIRRLPLYLRVLRDMNGREREVVSSSYLAADLGVEQIVVKKDLELTGVSGKTGVGYRVSDLIEAIEAFLGWNNTTDAFLVGVGHLGSALLGYEGFRNHGLNLVAAFDTNPEKIGGDIHGVSIFPLKKLPNLAQRLHVRLAVLTVPATAAQHVTDTLADAGICGIWNFTPTKLRAPKNMIIQREDLAGGLAELSIKLKQTHTAKGTTRRTPL